ncbi:hypothetical protein PG990_003447 [Apiospora arundinis]
MTTDPKEQQQPNGAPDLKLAITDWGGKTQQHTPKQAASEEDNLSPRSTAVRSGGPFEMSSSKSCRGSMCRGEEDIDYQGQSHSLVKPQASSGVTTEWGNLFNSEGHATPRFGQIMRVLSGHVISKFCSEDNGSVMTPDGLRRFYVTYRLDAEVFPFIDVFSSKSPEVYRRIADFLLDMECQHHLVQPNEHLRPLVPALTVVGFAQYYMSCILAYPDTEFYRLERIVADVPSIVVMVANPMVPEVLPKVIHRNQLPPSADIKSKQLLDSAFEDLMYDLDLPPPPPRKESPRHHHPQITAAAKVSPSPQPYRNEPKPATAADEKLSSFLPLGPSRSASYRKHVQSSHLHTIGDDDGNDNPNANQEGDGGLARERELERASMPGPRPGHARQHSWHAEHAGGGGGPAGVPHHHHRQASERNRRYYPGHAGQSSFSGAPESAQVSGGSGMVVPLSSTTGPPRGSVSSNVSSSGYWGHGGRTPPPTRHNSTSVPDVSSTGPFSFSSSSSSSAVGVATPAATPASSSGPVSPATSITHQWNPLQYRPTDSRNSSFSGGVDRQEQLQQKIPHHVRWEGVAPQKGGSEPLPVTPAGAPTSSKTGSVVGGQNPTKTERRSSQQHRHNHHGGHHHHRRFPSSGASSTAGDKDDYGDDGNNNSGNSRKKGETWEEYLRAQRKGEGYHSR